MVIDDPATAALAAATEAKARAWIEGKDFDAVVNGVQDKAFELHPQDGYLRSRFVIAAMMTAINRR